MVLMWASAGNKLLLLQVKEKPKLSAEEARKQAEEVLRKAKEKREVRGSALLPGPPGLWPISSPIDLQTLLSMPDP